MNANKAAQLTDQLFYKNVPKAATRNGFGRGLVAAAKTDDKIVGICADLTESTNMHLFAKEFPDRFFNVGVAEQNMAGIAAGFGLSGKTVFMASYAVFSPGRNWDFIRTAICYSRANVKIVGGHAGVATGADGATHQALEDIALMQVLPNLTVISAIDEIEAYKATVAAAKHTGPVYLRLAREKTPIITTDNSPFEIGRAQVLTHGTDITILGTGPIIYEALLAAKEVPNISCEIINVATIKPLDKKTIIESVKKTKRAVTIEDHQINAGFGSAICTLISQEFPIPVKVIGMQDTFAESGSYTELKNKYFLDKTYIKKVLANFK